jgi:Nucleolar protein,Nop52
LIENNNIVSTIMVEDEADAAAGSTKAMKDKEAKKKTVATTTISKRQQTKHADQGKNVWPQFPKLQGVERREKAHLRASGLSGGGGGNNKKKAKADNNDNDDTTMMLFQHLGRALGGPDAIVRHQAVLQLETYLKARCEATGLSELDLLKISKCLWYTLYLADRQVTST